MKIIRTTLAGPIEHEDGNRYALTNAENGELIAIFVPSLSAIGKRREKDTPDDNAWAKLVLPRLMKETMKNARHMDGTPETVMLRKDVRDFCLAQSSRTGWLHLPPEEMLDEVFLAEVSKALAKRLQWPTAKRYCMENWDRDKDVDGNSKTKLCELGAEKIAEVLNAIEGSSERPMFTSEPATSRDWFYDQLEPIEADDYRTSALAMLAILDATLVYIVQHDCSAIAVWSVAFGLGVDVATSKSRASIADGLRVPRRRLDREIAAFRATIGVPARGLL